MRYLYGIILVCVALSSFSPNIFAQTANVKIPVPATVGNHCLMKSSGGIEHCPEYRTQLRDINTQLSQKWTFAELEGQITLYDILQEDLAGFESEEGKKYRTSLEGVELFLRDYKHYLTKLFLQFFNNHTNEGNLVTQFFKTTYFQEDQSGLGISELNLYTKKPERYDKNIILQLAVRNFSANQMSNIEDVYCFTTLNDQDYIYPINIRPSFKENSITNLIIELKTGISPLLENIGQKKIACTLVYTQFGEKKYTNRGTLMFDIKEYKN